METSAGPGKADAQSGDLAELRQQFAEFGEVQAQQSRTLDIHGGLLVGLSQDMQQLRDDVTGIEVKVDTLQADMADVKGSLKEILNRLPAKAA
jgi:chaperonin cofactor prefoldin